MARLLLVPPHHLLMPSLPPDAITEFHCRKWGWLWLLLLTAVLYFPGLGTLPMMDRDEPRFAHATLEMMQRGSWAVPYFNNEYRFDKPPLTYWWMSLHYRLFGVHELAARLHTVVAVWLIALVTAAIGRRLFNARSGMLAAAAWLVTTQVLVHGRLCVADMPLVFCITLALHALVHLPLHAEGDASRWSRWHWQLYAALGAGFLAKGPLALLIPALALLLYRWLFWRKPVSWAALGMGRGLPLTLLIIAAWGVPALIETHGMFWRIGMGEHVIERGARSFNGRFPLPGYYLVTALLSLFPWIAFLPQVIRHSRLNWNSATALLTAWFAAPYLIFTCYATQLPHYVMPGFPAAMLLLVGIKSFVCGPAWHRWWSVSIAMLWLLCASAMLWLSLAASWPAGLMEILRSAAAALAALAIFGALLIAALLWRSKAALFGASAALILLPFTTSHVFEHLRTNHAAVQIASDVSTLPPESVLIGWQFTEPSLVFHLHHFWRFNLDLPAIKEELVAPGPRLVVLLRQEWTLSKCFKQWRAGLPVNLPATDFSVVVDEFTSHHSDLAITRHRVFNAARSSWAEIVVMKRLH